MRLILCIDDKNGMAFNHRRQTRDKKQRQHMYRKIDGPLYVNAYTRKLLLEDKDHPELLSLEDLDLKDKSASVFIENEDIEKYVEYADQIMIYRWNRIYLSDLYFDEKNLEGYRLFEKDTFSGTSHPGIEFNIYERI